MIKRPDQPNVTVNPLLKQNGVSVNVIESGDGKNYPK